MSIYVVAYLMLATGVSVYRSCTRYRDMMVSALAIDFFVAAIALFGFWLAGAFK
jgi:hypothetical protein